MPINNTSDVCNFFFQENQSTAAFSLYFPCEHIANEVIRNHFLYESTTRICSISLLFKLTSNVPGNDTLSQHRTGMTFYLEGKLQLAISTGRHVVTQRWGRGKYLMTVLHSVLELAKWEIQHYELEVGTQ